LLPKSLLKSSQDINHSGDGGIYAELIQNRAFQGSQYFLTVLEPWEPVGNTAISLNNASLPLSSALPTSLHVTGNDQELGFSNPGWWGIDVRPQTYQGSFYVTGAYYGNFTLSLVSNTSDAVFATTNVVSQSVDGAWVQHIYTLTPTSAASDTNNSLVLTFNGNLLGCAHSLDFNLISLFPPTYNDRLVHE
jgi:alpha-N-arabinofuranosidase